MAFVFFVIFFFKSKIEIFCVKISTSAKIGFAPTFKIQDADELYDLGVVITSSPSFRELDFKIDQKALLAKG